MMTKIETLHSIFNQDFVSYNKNEVLIEEKDSGARVNNIKLTNADFYSFNKKQLDSVNELFKKDKKQDKSLAKGCDGVVLFKKDDTWYFFLIELKSKFSTSNIDKAQEQIQITHPKLMMTLNIVKDFIDLSKLVIKGFIISEKPDDEIKLRIDKKHKSNDGYCIEHLCFKLINKSNYAVILKEHSALKYFNLADYCLFDKIELHHIEASDNNAVLDVNDYC